MAHNMGWRTAATQERADGGICMSSHYEKDIAKLDKEEITVHHNQMQLVREQLSAFSQDLGTLHNEVMSVKAFQTQLQPLCANGNLNHRLTALEAEVSSHGEELKNSMNLFSDIRTKVQESFQQDLKSFMSTLSDTLAKVQDNLEQDRATHAFQHENLSDSLEALEIKLQDEVALRDASVGELRTLLGGEHVISVVEKMLGELHCSQDLEAAHGKLDELHTKLAQLSDRASRHSKEAGLLASGNSVAGRLECTGFYVENVVNELMANPSAIQHSLPADYQNLQKQVEELYGHFSDERDSRQALALSLEDLRKEQNMIRKDRHPAVAQQPSLGKDAEIEAIDNRVQQLCNCFAEECMAREELQNLVDRLQADYTELKSQRVTQKEGQDKQVDIPAGDVEALRGRLDELCGCLLEECMARKALSSSVGALQTYTTLANERPELERLGQLEKVIQETSERQAQELAGAHTRVDQLLGQLAEEKESIEAHRAAIDQIVTTQREHWDAHLAELKDRVLVIENISLQGLDNLDTSYPSNDNTNDNSAHKHQFNDDVDPFISNADTKNMVANNNFHNNDDNNSDLKDNDNSNSYANNNNSNDNQDNSNNPNTEDNNCSMSNPINQNNTGGNINNVGNMLGPIRALETAEAEALGEQLALLADQLATLEQMCVEANEKTNQELENNSGKLEQLASLVVGELEARDASHSELTDRVTRLEEAPGSSLAALERMGRIETDVEVLGASQGMLGDRVGCLETESENRESSHRELLERLGRLETVLTEPENEPPNMNEEIDENFKECLDCGKPPETLAGRISSLIERVNNTDGLIRKETEDRQLDNQRLWEAIDNHTHDIPVERCARLVGLDTAQMNSGARLTDIDSQSEDSRSFDSRASRLTAPHTQASIGRTTYPSVQPSTPPAPFTSWAACSTASSQGGGGSRSGSWAAPPPTSSSSQVEWANAVPHKDSMCRSDSVPLRTIHGSPVPSLPIGNQSSSVAPSSQGHSVAQPRSASPTRVVAAQGQNTTMPAAGNQHAVHGTATRVTSQQQQSMSATSVSPSPVMRNVKPVQTLSRLRAQSPVQAVPYSSVGTPVGTPGVPQGLMQAPERRSPMHAPSSATMLRR